MFLSSRRSFLKSVSGLALVPFVSLSPFRSLIAAEQPVSSIMTKPIPATGEHIPVIGMGSWITFDVGGDEDDRARCVKILEVLFEKGGGMVDSSPMYGSSQEVIGHCLKQLGYPPGLFPATKVWILSKLLGVSQMEFSMDLWGTKEPFDLMQIHNMLDWRSHLETLKEWKSEGQIRYIGITTSHGRRHEDLEQALKEEDFDFVQLTYNIVDREVEQRLLPLAAEKGIAVIANRPFQRKALINRVEGRPLPDWAPEIDCANWPQFLLKYIVSHPAITCAIPATSQIPHMRENMGAGYGALPDPAMRKRMARYYADIT